MSRSYQGHATKVFLLLRWKYYNEGEPLREIFLVWFTCPYVCDGTIKTRKHSSAMRTAHSWPYRGGGFLSRGTPGQSPFSGQTAAPHQRPHRQRSPWTDTPLTDTSKRNMGPVSQTGIDIIQRPPFPPDRHLWKHYLAPNFVCGR